MCVAFCLSLSLHDLQGKYIHSLQFDLANPGILSLYEWLLLIMWQHLNSYSELYSLVCLDKNHKNILAVKFHHICKTALILKCCLCAFMFHKWCRLPHQVVNHGRLFVGSLEYTLTLSQNTAVSTCTAKQAYQYLRGTVIGLWHVQVSNRQSSSTKR